VFFSLFGAEMYGFDISPEGIKVANKMAEINNVSDKCHFSVQNASSMSYPDEKFDIVVLHEVLHHLIKYKNVKEEILRVLKKGGIVICADAQKGCFLHGIGRFFTMRGKEAKGDIVLTMNDLADFATGFEDVKIEMMSILFMAKRMFRNHLYIPPLRWFLFLLKKTDDFLLLLFPKLQKYCGEYVMVLRK